MPCYKCTPRLLYHSSPDVHRSCFHLSVVMNNAAANMNMQISEMLPSILLDLVPKVGLPDHVVILYLILGEPPFVMLFDVGV